MTCARSPAGSSTLRVSATTAERTGRLRRALEGAGPTLAAVDGNVGSVDPTGPVGEHECHHVGYFFGVSQAAPGEFATLELLEPVWLLGLEALPAAAGKQDRSGADRVDADPVR